LNVDPARVDRQISPGHFNFMKPKLLDLFCCAGGAAAGYHKAGFEIVGVDIKPQPRYPFEFIQANALTFPLSGFNAIHASPPCQRYSDLARRNGNAHEHPDFVPVVRRRLRRSGLPFIIENVEGSPLISPIMLCGTMFPGLRVLRHRLFESNILFEVPKHGKHPLVFTHDKRKPHWGKIDQDKSFVMVNGGGNCSIKNAKAAMQIDWMTKPELNEAIPPAYTEFLGKQLLQFL
jgi:DNA (cytosine-5)-methyltransferase 1